MRRGLLALVVLLAGISFHTVVRAAHVDGPDFGRPIKDFGDAPEEIPIWGTAGRIGHFPTCLQPTRPCTHVPTRKTTCGEVKALY